METTAEQTTGAALAGHTPGPWRYYRDEPCTDETWPIVVDKDGGIVANVNFETGPDHPATRKMPCMANARLIAAAPELLAALTECITSEGAACFGDMKHHPEWMQRRLYAISDIARAAIAKATPAL